MVKALNKVPVLGDPVERMLWQAKESIKAGLHGGMLFEELGFRYFGPIDGHSIPQLLQILEDGQGHPRSGAFACGHGEGARLPAGGRRPGLLPHTGSFPA